MIQSSQGLDEYVGALVPKLVTSSDEEVQSFIQIEIVMPIKMTSNELVYLLFTNSVQILKFMKCRELFYVEPVRRNDVGFSFQQMLRFEASYV